MVGQARERNFNGPGIYLWVRGNGSPRNNATRRERERGGGRKKGRKNEKGSMTRARIVLSPCNDELWKEGEEKRKKEKRIHEERMFPCTRKTVVWHRAFYNAETRKGQLRARLSSNHLTFFSESRLPRAILPFSSLQQLLR